MMYMFDQMKYLFSICLPFAMQFSQQIASDIFSQLQKNNGW